MSTGQLRNSTPGVTQYTQEQLNAIVSKAVDDAVKFLNECNARQAETIADLREQLEKAKTVNLTVPPVVPPVIGVVE